MATNPTPVPPSEAWCDHALAAHGADGCTEAGCPCRVPHAAFERGAEPDEGADAHLRAAQHAEGWQG